MAKATQKQVNLTIIDTALLRLETLDLLNGFKRKSRGARVSMASNIIELKKDLEKLKNNINGKN